MLVVFMMPLSVLVNIRDTQTAPWGNWLNRTCVITPYLVFMWHTEIEEFALRGHKETESRILKNCQAKFVHFTSRHSWLFLCDSPDSQVYFGWELETHLQTDAAATQVCRLSREIYCVNHEMKTEIQVENIKKYLSQGGGSSVCWRVLDSSPGVNKTWKVFRQ